MSSACLLDIITNETSSRGTQRDGDRVRKMPAGVELVSQRLHVLGFAFDVLAEFQNKATPQKGHGGEGTERAPASCQTSEGRVCPCWQECGDEVEVDEHGSDRDEFLKITPSSKKYRLGIRSSEGCKSMRKTKQFTFVQHVTPRALNCIKENRKSLQQSTQA